MEVFDVLSCRFHRDGKGTQGTEKTLRKGMEEVAGQVHLSLKGCTHATKMREGPQPRLQHCNER